MHQGNVSLKPWLKFMQIFLQWKLRRSCWSPETVLNVLVSKRKLLLEDGGGREDGAKFRSCEAPWDGSDRHRKLHRWLWVLSRLCCRGWAPQGVLVTQWQLFWACPFLRVAKNGKILPRTCGSRTRWNKGWLEGSLLTCWVFCLIRQLYSNWNVLMLLHSLRPLLSWLAGCVNPGPAVYPVQKVFGCKRDERT